MIKLIDLLKLLYKGQWIVVGTRTARCYEGYANSFDVDNLLDENVLMIDTVDDGILHILVGSWGDGK